jgi:hypothetical protein
MGGRSLGMEPLVPEISPVQSSCLGDLLPVLDETLTKETGSLTNLRGNTKNNIKR